MPPKAQGLSFIGYGPVALKCIETSAVCNSKMPIGTDSVNPSGFRNRIRRLSLGKDAQNAQGSTQGKSNPGAIAVRGSREFSVKNERVADGEVRGTMADAIGCGYEDLSFSVRRRRAITFMALSCQARHLSLPWSASDESCSRGQNFVSLPVSRANWSSWLDWTAGGRLSPQGRSLDLSIRQMFK
jgi:hypothetical protein